MSPTAAHDSAGSTPIRLRASDSERFAVAEVLQDAVGTGLLTPAEGSERTAAAFAAVYRDELGPLTQDLPTAPRGGRRSRPAGTPGGPGRSRTSGWLGRAQAAALSGWLVVVGTVSGWSPRRRIVVGAVLLALLVAVFGLGLLGHDGGGRDGFDGPGSGVRGFPGDAAERATRG